MIKKMFIPIKRDEDLSYYFNRLSKLELDYIRKRLYVKNASSLNKTNLIKILSNEIINNVDFIVKNLGKMEFQILENAVKFRGVMKGDFDDYDIIYNLQEWGIAFFGTSEEDDSTIIVPHELISRVKGSFKDKELINLARKLQRCYESVKGYLYYYGVSNSFDLYQLVKGNFSEVTFHDFIEYLFNNAGVEKDINFCNGYFYHWTVMDPEHIMDEHKLRPNLKYAEIPYEKAIAAADDDYREWNQYARELYDFFIRVGKVSFDEAGEMVDICIVDIKNDTNFMEIVNYLGENIKLPSFKDAEEMIEILQNVYNSINKWVLKGHTSNEIFEEEKKFLRPMPTKSKKTGRNEPCPCGSGRKYKNCCGKS